ncbi:MAG TPA: ATP-binding protein [Gammaproteobacteria bacterium]|nr:ATP-binding protein [Gammaproteobacteria bacterium]
MRNATLNLGLGLSDRTATLNRAWRALRYFNLYRLIIAGLFAVLSGFGRLPPNFTQFDEHRILWTSLSYLTAATLFHLCIERRRPSLVILRNVQVVLDIVALTVLMHASGGVAGGFGILLVIAIAGACLLASPRAAVGFAAIASLAVLGETLFGVLELDYREASYTQAGLLGAGLFGTAILASWLAEQARRSEALAAARARDLQALAELNEHIVQRMRSGIVVLDDTLRVLLINQAAARMLDLQEPANGRALAELSPVLDGARHAWVARSENRKTPLDLDGRGNQAIVSFTNLGVGVGENTLVFLEDAAETQQRAQQLKLASLGRLTASIAHEIRNPLGAISHAGQLLSESPHLGREDRRLIEIIDEHSKRMNAIIKNVMMIGRREMAVAESFGLKDWLESFVAEVAERHALAPDEVVFECREPDIIVRMDRSQLHQVLWNLCENGLRYSRRAPKLRFVCGRDAASGRPWVDVVDSGPGMPGTIAEQIFEPFFTSGGGGTGLGLYIARELCEANQATLTLAAHGESGCTFRILFAHPDRQQLSA